jgi:hypothetical protein
MGLPDNDCGDSPAVERSKGRRAEPVSEQNPAARKHT